MNWRHEIGCAVFEGGLVMIAWWIVTYLLGLPHSLLVALFCGFCGAAGSLTASFQTARSKRRSTAG